jgi:hypothetical protein
LRGGYDLSKRTSSPSVRIGGEQVMPRHAYATALPSGFF